MAAADSLCPICLRDTKKAAYVAYCMNCFCFACIRRWARASNVCPLSRQPLEQQLHPVRGNDNFKEYVPGLPARLHRRMAMERACSRSPQRRYNLCRRPTATCTCNPESHPYSELHQKKHSSRLREPIFPLMRPHLEYCIELCVVKSSVKYKLKL